MKRKTWTFLSLTMLLGAFLLLSSIVFLAVSIAVSWLLFRRADLK